MAPVDQDVLTSAEAGGKVIRGSAARIAANVAGIALGLATATLLLRHLGVEDSGRYVTVLSLVGIAVTVVDTGLNLVANSELAKRDLNDRRVLLANIIGQRLAIAPIALFAVFVFAAIAGYPSAMIAGTALVGAGAFLVAVANAMLVPLTVELRNAGVAFVEFLRQFVTLAGVALLVALGASLTPIFAVQLAVGLVVLTVAPFLVGRKRLVRPRFDRPQQRQLLSTALPIAIALALGQIYFRLVIVLMSLISSSEQTGYFGGSLRAMEALITFPALVASVALPLLAAVRDDRDRLRYALAGLSEGALIAGVFVILVMIRAAEPLMTAIGGEAFRPSGAVLRIQVIALLFIALYQIWGVALVALGRQRDLILTNGLALLGMACFAGFLIPSMDAQGGAIATVLGDALLASLIYWRLSLRTSRLALRPGFVTRLVAAALVASIALIPSALPDIVAALLSGTVFLALGWAIGMIPEEVREMAEPLRRATRLGR